MLKTASMSLEGGYNLVFISFHVCFFLLQSALDNLITTMVQSDIHYIRCLKPNNSSSPGVFQAPCVLQQMRACGTIETVDICRLGYPARCGWLHACVCVDVCEWVGGCIKMCSFVHACVYIHLSACMSQCVWLRVCDFAIICWAWTLLSFQDTVTLALPDLVTESVLLSGIFLATSEGYTRFSVSCFVSVSASTCSCACTTLCNAFQSFGLHENHVSLCNDEVIWPWTLYSKFFIVFSRRNLFTFA